MGLSRDQSALIQTYRMRGRRRPGLPGGWDWKGPASPLPSPRGGSGSSPRTDWGRVVASPAFSFSLGYPLGKRFHSTLYSFIHSSRSLFNRPDIYQYFVAASVFLPLPCLLITLLCNVCSCCWPEIVLPKVTED